MRFIFVLRITFDLQQEVCSHASGILVKALFIFSDQCLYVNKSLN